MYTLEDCNDSTGHDNNNKLLGKGNIIFQLKNSSQNISASLGKVPSEAGKNEEEN